MSYESIMKFSDEAANALVESIDYNTMKLYSTCIQIDTKYRGRGRPRYSDYTFLRHPTGDIFVVLHI